MKVALVVLCVSVLVVRGVPVQDQPQSEVVVDKDVERQQPSGAATVVNRIRDIVQQTSSGIQEAIANAGQTAQQGISVVTDALSPSNINRTVIQPIRQSLSTVGQAVSPASINSSIIQPVAQGIAPIQDALRPSSINRTVITPIRDALAPVGEALSISNLNRSIVQPIRNGIRPVQEVLTVDGFNRTVIQPIIGSVIRPSRPPVQREGDIPLPVESQPVEQSKEEKKDVADKLAVEQKGAQEVKAIVDAQKPLPVSLDEKVVKQDKIAPEEKSPVSLDLQPVDGVKSDAPALYSAGAPEAASPVSDKVVDLLKEKDVQVEKQADKSKVKYEKKDEMIAKPVKEAEAVKDKVVQYAQSSIEKSADVEKKDESILKLKDIVEQQKVKEDDKKIVAPMEEKLDVVKEKVESEEQKKIAVPLEKKPLIKKDEVVKTEEKSVVEQKQEVIQQDKPVQKIESSEKVSVKSAEKPELSVDKKKVEVKEKIDDIVTEIKIPSDVEKAAVESKQDDKVAVKIEKPEEKPVELKAEEKAALPVEIKEDKKAALPVEEKKMQESPVKVKDLAGEGGRDEPIPNPYEIPPVEKDFTKYDADKDGKIAYKEFHKVHQAYVDILRQFRDADINSDEYLTSDEFQKGPWFNDAGVESVKEIPQEEIIKEDSKKSQIVEKDIVKKSEVIAEKKPVEKVEEAVKSMEKPGKASLEDVEKIKAEVVKQEDIKVEPLKAPEVKEEKVAEPVVKVEEVKQLVKESPKVAVPVDSKDVIKSVDAKEQIDAVKEKILEPEVKQSLKELEVKKQEGRYVDPDKADVSPAQKEDIAAGQQVDKVAPVESAMAQKSLSEALKESSKKSEKVKPAILSAEHAKKKDTEYKKSEYVKKASSS